MLSLSKTGVKTVPISRVEYLFLLFLLIFGGALALLIPPGAGYDEEDHLVRVWELSAFSFIPGQMRPRELQYPTLFRNFAYRQQGSAGVIDSEFWAKYAQAPLNAYGFVRRELDTKSVYSPALLLPQSMTMRLLGRRATLPGLWVFYACRFASLLSYMILAWLAIRWIPFGKWILLILAVSPIALFQAATITPDAISNGIGFLFIAGCLRMAVLEKINWKEIGFFIFLVFLLFLAKLNLLPLILLPFLLVSPKPFLQKRMYLVLLAMTVVLFFLEILGWNGVALSRSEPLLANGANPTAQLAYIVQHPFAFFQALLRDLLVNGLRYFRGWINGYGYYYWTPPLIVSLFFLLSLGSVLFFDSTREHVSTKFRSVFLLIFVGSYLTTVLSLYVAFTPVGSGQIFGVQGRYFIPSAVLLMLAIASFSWTRKTGLLAPNWSLVPLAFALSLNIIGIFLAFYVPCGTTFYQSGLCYRPLFKNVPAEAHPSPLITNEISLSQEIEVACNGLTEVRVLLAPSVASDRGSTRFLLEDRLNHQTLLDQSVSNGQITAEGWYPLHVAPEWQSAGRQYVLKITGVKTSPDQGLRVLYTAQSEFNLGNLYENESPIKEDLVLQYGCATGLRRIWLRAMSLNP